MSFISGDFSNFIKAKRGQASKVADTSVNTAKILSKADKDKDGKVSTEEFSNFMKSGPHDRKSLDEKFISFDADEDGSLSVEEMKEFTKAVDKNGDGKLSSAEKSAAKTFIKYAPEGGKIDKTTMGASQILSKADSDRDGEVTVKEFAKNVARISDEENIAKIAELDVDGDGKLTTEEVAEFTSKVDRNGDGKMSFREKIEAKNYVKYSEAIAPKKEVIEDEPIPDGENPGPCASEEATGKTDPNKAESETKVADETVKAEKAEAAKIEAETNAAKTEAAKVDAEAKAAEASKPSAASIEKAATFLSRVDNNNDSTVNYNEFAQSIGIYSPNASLKEKIAKFDKNMDGNLSTEEVANLLAKMDLSGDGIMSYEEQTKAQNMFKFSDNPYSS